MNVKERLMQVIIYITIPVFLLIFFASLLTTTPYLQLSKGLYSTHEQITYDQDYAIERIIGYLNYRYDDLEFGATEGDQTVLLRDVEIRHMVDVKNLYTMLRIGALGSLIIGGGLLLHLYRKNKQVLYHTLKNIHKGPIIFALFLGSAFIIDFNLAFRVFHELFFTNDDWLLYNNDVLILLLPTAFWMVSAFIILVLFLLSMFGINRFNKKILSKKL
jgi:integral membrane protein (TIGR01906 family)